MPQPPHQALVAYIVGLALADHRPEGPVQHAVRHEQTGEEGQILLHHGGLEGDTGGGDEKRPAKLSIGGPPAVEHRAGHQIGIGLADPCPGVTQGNAAVQHGVQHSVAQSSLRRTLRHAFGGE